MINYISMYFDSYDLHSCPNARTSATEPARQFMADSKATRYAPAAHEPPFHPVQSAIEVRLPSKHIPNSQYTSSQHAFARM